MTNSEDLINIEARIMPRGEVIDLELPLFSTGNEIIEACMDGELLAKTDHEGNPYTYEVITKSNVKIGEDKTLFDVGLKEGEMIYIVPKMSAG